MRVELLVEADEATTPLEAVSYVERHRWYRNYKVTDDEGNVWLVNAETTDVEPYFGPEISELADEFAENALNGLARVLRTEGRDAALAYIERELQAGKDGDPYAEDPHNLEVARDRLTVSR